MSSKERKLKAAMKIQLDFIQKLLIQFFTRYASITAKYPKTTLAIPLLITAISAPGLFLISFLEDIEYQFTPYNGRTVGEREIIRKLFPMNYSSSFSVSRQVEFKYNGRFIVQSKIGKNVLQREVFDEILRLDSEVRKITLEDRGEDWRYRDLCARKDGKCHEPALLNLKDAVDDINNGTYKVRFPLHIEKNGMTHHFYGMALGGVTVNEDGCIVAAEAALLDYYLDASKKEFFELNTRWEGKFLELGETFRSEHITAYRFISATLNDEFGTDTFNSMGYFIITVIIMVIFGVVTSMMSDCVRSKPWFGILGCISSTIAVASSFGILLYFKLEFVTINLVIPFLMLGIGLDDTFVIMAAWRRTSPDKSVEVRMRETYEHAGVSITITSITNIASFLMGSTSPFRAANILCYYAALSVLLTYVYQLCFFGGCLALFGKAEEKNLHSITMRKAVPKSLSKHRGRLFQMFCTGGKDPNNPDNPEDNQDHVVMLLFRDKLGMWLSKPLVKVVVLLFFAAYLGLGLYGCTKIKEGQNMHKIFAMGSYADEFAKRDQKYFYNYLLRLQVVIDTPLDYSNPLVQEQVLNMSKALEALPYSSNSSLNEFWLKHYLKFLKMPASRFLSWRYNLTNQKDFIYCLENFFFKHPLARDYREDVVFNENKTEIIATRFFYQINGVDDILIGRDLIVGVWNLIDSFPYKSFAYHPYLKLMEIQVGLTNYTMKTFTITALIMMFITFLFIPNIICATWVAFTIVSIEIGIMGYMTFWDVNINPPSMVSLIISVGFSVDNAAHITYAYVCSKKRDPDAKMRDALYYVGMPIAQACVSTIIGVAVLPLTPSYNFHVFFKTMTLLMSFAMVHSLLLLPVLLSLADMLLARTTKTFKNSMAVYRYEEEPATNGNTTVTDPFLRPKI